MLKLAVDEDLDNDLVHGLLKQKPDLDIVRAQDAGLSGMDDPLILEWAAEEGRILLTHDKKTMTDFAYARIRAGQSTPGVFVVRKRASMRLIIEDILLIVEISLPGEWEGQVRYVPL